MSDRNPTSPREEITLDDLHSLPMPEGFSEARQHIRAALAACDGAGLPPATVTTALLAEVMPRLVAAYGPVGVSEMLKRLGHVIGASRAMHQ
jgi:hypothetical protein